MTRQSVLSFLFLVCSSALAVAADSFQTKALIKQKHTQIKEMREIYRKNILKINELEACAKSNNDEHCKALNANYGLDKGECDRACGLTDQEGFCKHSDYVALMVTPRDMAATKVPTCVVLYDQAKSANDEIFNIVSKDCGKAISSCAMNKRSKKIEEIEAHNLAIKKDIQDYEGEITQLIKQQQEIVKRVKNVVKKEQTDDCPSCARSDSELKIINAYPELFEPEVPVTKTVNTSVRGD